MRYRLFTCFIVGAIVSAGQAQQDAETLAPQSTGWVARQAADPGAAGPIASRQNAFSIPFSVSNAQEPAEQPIEVQLYTSRDRGVRWSLYGREHPTAGAFQFQTAQDGEYWFAVRTLDRAGKLRPPAITQPELRVLIDTVAPKLQLQASIGPSGEVVTAWQAEDERLRPESFQLEFQTAPGQPWQKVAVSGQRSGADAALSGRETWWPGAAGRQIALRAEVRDQAGNVATVNRQLQLPRVAGATPPLTNVGQDTLAQSASEGAPPTTPGATAGLSSSAGLPTASLPRTAGQASSGTPAPSNVAAQAGQMAIPWLSNAPQSTPRPAMVGSDNTTSPGTLARSASEGVARTTPATAGQANNTTGDLAGDPYQAVPGTVHPPVSQQVATPARSASLPAGVEPQRTRVRRFNLEYEVDAAGPAGVAKVELWFTRDGGQTWDRFGVDTDRQSPMLVEMDRDGTFGFRMVIHPAGGVPGRLPQSGEAADVWIAIDATEPQARITSARYGAGSQLGQLGILWQADDAELAERPIRLAYSDQPAGPWTTIAEELPNTGQYDWRAGGQLPEQIYLRLEVRDAAGNVAIHQLDQPIDSSGLMPSGRIRGIQPADQPELGAYQLRAYR